MIELDFTHCALLLLTLSLYNKILKFLREVHLCQSSQNYGSFQSFKHLISSKMPTSCKYAANITKIKSWDNSVSVMNNQILSKKNFIAFCFHHNKNYVFITPQPLRAVGVLFSPMVSGWAGGRREKFFSGLYLRNRKV